MQLRHVHMHACEWWPPPTHPLSPYSPSQNACVASMCLFLPICLFFPLSLLFPLRGLCSLPLHPLFLSLSLSLSLCLSLYLSPSLSLSLHPPLQPRGWRLHRLHCSHIPDLASGLTNRSFTVRPCHAYLGFSCCNVTGPPAYSQSFVNQAAVKLFPLVRI